MARERAGSGAGFVRRTRDMSRETLDGGGVRFFLKAISMIIPTGS